MAEASWTDELKEEVVEAYVSAEPTPENSMELVKELAEQYDKTPNGVRMILSKAEVYVKKNLETSSSSSAKKEKKMSKADAIAGLKKAIVDTGAEVDDAIVDKMTGKAAEYFIGVVNTARG